jgi:hypothetical protein
MSGRSCRRKYAVCKGRKCRVSRISGSFPARPPFRRFLSVRATCFRSLPPLLAIRTPDRISKKGRSRCVAFTFVRSVALLLLCARYGEVIRAGLHRNSGRFQMLSYATIDRLDCFCQNESVAEVIVACTVPGIAEVRQQGQCRQKLRGKPVLLLEIAIVGTSFRLKNTEQDQGATVRPVCIRAIRGCPPYFL